MTLGHNIEKIFPLILEVYANCGKRITTHELNSFVQKAMQVTPPPMMGGKRLRVYYSTQVGVYPPTFVLFINYPDLMLRSYKRYLYNQFREKYGFSGSPALFHLKAKKREKRERPDKTPPLYHHAPEEMDEDIDDVADASFLVDNDVWEGDKFPAEPE